MSRLPDVSSPQDLLEITLDKWAFDFRGDEPSEEELRTFFSWYLKGGECPLPDPRAIQVFCWFLDSNLGELGRATGKVLRRPTDEGLTAAQMAAAAEELDVRFIWNDREWTVLDLWVEEQCARHVLWLLNRMKERWRNLRVTLVDESLSETTFDYLEEAASSYLLGQYRACICLCRSAMEAALKDTLPGVSPGSELELRELIEKAEEKRRLVGRYLRFAHDVRKKANRVVHPRQRVDNNVAREVLHLTAEVIEVLK